MILVRTSVSKDVLTQRVSMDVGDFPAVFPDALVLKLNELANYGLLGRDPRDLG